MTAGINSAITDDILKVAHWGVRHLSLANDKMDHIWNILQRHKTLFSDFTRGDKSVWVQLVTRPDTFWLEVHDLSAMDALVGLIYFEGVIGIDVDAHLVYFDRKPAEKVEVTRQALRYMFQEFPIQRITVTIPVIFNATGRMLDKLGFKREGKKRASVLLGGHWVDQYIYGLLRSEAWAGSPKV